MNPRERRLLVALVLIVGGGGGAVLGYQMFYRPLVEYNAAIRRLERENQQKDDQLLAIFNERPLLERARAMSLSPSPDMASAEYFKYLQNLVEECPVEIDVLRPGPVTEVKAVPGGPTGVKPGHQIISFQLQVRGELDGVIQILGGLKKTPLVHRVRNLSIARADTSAKNATDQLVMGMTIESLIISKAETRADGPLVPDERLVATEALLRLRHAPGGLVMLPWIIGPTGPFARQKLALASGYRRYTDMERKNIFVGPGGVARPSAGQTDEEAAAAAAAAADDAIVLDYVRLDTTDPDNHEAFFRNLMFKARPLRVQSVAGGYRTFRIYNELRTRVLLEGKVLRIDQRDVYFQVKDEVYAVHIGQSLTEAMREQLFDDDMTRLQLTSLFDPQWAKR